MLANARKCWQVISIHEILINEWGSVAQKKQNQEQRLYKQNKNIDDKRMFKIGVEVLRKDFCVQIGYNRRAVKNYTDVSEASGPQPGRSTTLDDEENNDNTQQAA